MTRFLLPLSQAVDTILAAYHQGRRGETYVPRVPASLITNVAHALIGDRQIEMKETGVRPGEKLHEVLVAEDEIHRTTIKNDYYVIKPILPELSTEDEGQEALLEFEFSSDRALMNLEETRALLASDGLTIEDKPNFAARYG